jgi:integrase
VIVDYKASEDFRNLRNRTQSDYLKQIKKIEIAFGTLPLAALEDPRVTLEFKKWRDSMAAAPRQADYAWMVLMLLLSWARDNGLTTYRPPDRMKRLYHADRSEKIWKETHIARFMAVASEPLRRALVLALETGQRQGDLLALPWSAYDGQWIRLRQSKSKRHNREGRKVEIPVTRRLRAVLDNTKRSATVILTNKRGLPWGADAFRNAWADASRKAGITDLHFHDLRGTAVTRLAEAGCTHIEIAPITGHSLHDVGAILDKYLARTDKIALAAIAKLERGKA